MKVIVTGGAGFIGSCFIRLLIQNRPEWQVVNFDKLTYAGNLENLESVSRNPHYQFVHGDIADTGQVTQLFEQIKPDAVVHFAAESHVDRSILSPEPVFQTNLRGTFTLLEALRTHGLHRFVHVSTDEVYGSLEPPLSATEDFPLRPSSPYSASKAGSDLLALSYWVTYHLPVVVTRASNNYGPYQFPEKLIPLMICNALRGESLPVYGDGLQVRDWLYVEDHCRGILAVLEGGQEGQVYNIGGSQPLTNLAIVHQILQSTGQPESLIRYVTDRPGHDRRYALSSTKLMTETGWKLEVPLERGLEQTISWYCQNQGWLERVRSQEYLSYYVRNYSHRV